VAANLGAGGLEETYLPAWCPASGVWVYLCQELNL